MVTELHSPSARRSTTTSPGCVHHWLIEAPSGPSSGGVCRRCGARRDFQNYTEALLWERADMYDPLRG